jgi:hypothetical protein
MAVAVVVVPRVLKMDPMTGLKGVRILNPRRSSGVRMAFFELVI